MYSSSGNSKFTSYNDTNDFIDEIFDSPRLKYPVNLETSMKVSYFIFDSVQIMYYKCHKVLYALVYILILQTG